MSEDPRKTDGKAGAEDREARLKDALRANLRRRKAAARKQKGDAEGIKAPQNTEKT